MLQRIGNLRKRLGSDNPVLRFVGAGIGYGVRAVYGNKVTAPDGQVFQLSPVSVPLNYFTVAIGAYERPEIDIITKWFKPDDTIIDIGASLGIAARYAYMNKLNPGGAYVCVEPNVNVLETLEANMREAAVLSPGKTFHIIGDAICSAEYDGKDVEFLARRSLGSALVTPNLPFSDGTVIHVPARSFSNLIGEFAPNGCSLVCDAEGAEISMLEEMNKTPDVFNGIRQIAIELHEPHWTGRPETPKYMIAGFNNLGFVNKAQIANTYYFNRGPH